MHMYGRIVVKVGTTTLTHQNGKLNLKRVHELSWVLTNIRNQGSDIILVSSGAIAVGADRLSLTERPRDIQGKQAASAVGQAVLMQIYENFFMEYNQIVAQILLTKDVLEHETRKQNAVNTFHALFQRGVIPIVNANDTIATDELEFSDNDTLSAYVACLTESDALIILSDIDGLYEADPKLVPDAKRIPVVERITEQMSSFAGDTQSSLGTGGMSAKLYAAKMATASGIDTIIASGDDPTVLLKILESEQVGTLFKRQTC